MTPLLSIITPNYNHGLYLEALCQNIAVQNGNSYEWVIIDDGSSDESLKIIRNLQRTHPFIRLVENGKNRGVEFSVKKGVELATGEFIFLRSADDLFTPGAFGRFQDVLSSFPNANLIVGDVLYFESNPRCGTYEKLGISKQTAEVGSVDYLEKYGGNIIHGAASFIRRKCLDQVGGICSQLRWHYDWYLIMRMAIKYGFIYEPFCFGAMRLNSKSYNSTGTLDQCKRNEVLKYLIQQLDATPSFKESLLKIGCLDFFGEPLKVAIKRYASDPDSYTALFKEPSPEVKQARDYSGLKFVIREFLKAHFDRIQKHEGSLVLFGSGGHSIQLVEVLSELGMRTVDGVIDNVESPEPRFFNGIKIVSPSELEGKRNPLVILSSKSYEPLFASTMKREAAGVPYLRIWGDCPV